MATAGRSISRRTFGSGATAVGALAMIDGLARRVVDRAALADPAGLGSLDDIDHFVLLMHENRSFDHYFGTMSSVRGFDDMPLSRAQAGYRPGVGVDPHGRLLPFHLAGTADPGTVSDPAHSWQVQHESWSQGAMDAWVSAHLRADGARLAPAVMGYYERSDLPVHYALADAFTVCDNYFSSALGPTAPNRMYWMTGTLGAGESGGPVLDEAVHIRPHSLRWTTFAENLTAAGVDWKVYNSTGPAHRSELSGMLKYFRAYRDPFSELYRRGIAPSMREFYADVESGTLPAVSWLVPTFADSEHPSYPPSAGASSIARVVDALTRNPAVWERTALIISYDENGGFFDHVAPVTAPAGTAGEWVESTDVDGTRHREAIGLGFRVPCLIVSPYTRGGRVYSGRADHTSQLRLIGERFDVPVPNLTSWRRSTVTDLTGAFQPHARRGTLTDFRQAAALETSSTVRSAISRAERGDVSAPQVPPNVLPRQDRRPIRPSVGRAV